MEGKKYLDQISGHDVTYLVIDIYYFNYCLLVL